MKLTSRGHYSIKALIDLSLQKNLRPISVREIAERQGLPAPYLEKLLIQLRKADLVASVRGAQGGYQLAKSPDKISLGEILEAVGENIEPLSEKAFFPDQASDWVTFSIWQRLQKKLQEALYNISLEDLYYDVRSWQASRGEETNFVI